MKKQVYKIQNTKVPIIREVKRIAKNGEKSTKTLSYKLQFIIVQDLQQAHDQILLRILLKEFIKCKHGYDNKKFYKCVELNKNIVSASFNTKTLKIISQSINFYAAIRITKKV